MFLDFYRLREQPFGVTPDSRFLYLDSSHREALASLQYGVETGRGFVAMIAKPGMGKTTLLFQLLERLRGCARTAFLFQTQCDSRELLRYLLTDAGLDAQEHDIVTLHHRFNQLLAREARSGKRFVVVIDEAQNLDEDSLETVRLLSDFETGRAKLLQIILAGQPQLAEKLASPKLTQLRQRIAILCRLKPLRQEETEKYIAHRLRAAGYEGPPLFTREALELIAHRSQGIPRNINNLCFSAMSLGCALDRAQIDSDVVEEVTLDLDMDALLKEEVEPLVKTEKQNGEALLFPPPNGTGQVDSAATISSCGSINHTVSPIEEPASSIVIAEETLVGGEAVEQTGPTESAKEWSYKERSECTERRSVGAIICAIVALSLLSGFEWGHHPPITMLQHSRAALLPSPVPSRDVVVVLPREGSQGYTSVGSEGSAE